MMGTPTSALARPRDNPPAVVLGGFGGALSVTRSLARHGVRVHVLGDRSSLVPASRHCAEFVDLGSSGDVVGRWLEWLDRGPRGAVVMPVGDDGLELVARHREWLLDRGYVPIEANDDVLLAMLDKQRTFELASLAGVAVPPTMRVSSTADAAAAAGRIGFPCALKPLHSHLFGRHFDVKLFVVEDVAQLERIVERTAALGLDMLATEIVPGGDDRYCSYYSYIDENGEALFHFTKRKPRQYPIHFGLGTYHVTDWSPDVAEAGLRFFQAVGVRGLANVEFKRDARDGDLKLIECNHRFTAANELVKRSGLDLAVHVYDHLLGRSVAWGGPYRSGARLWSPLEDMRAARQYRRAGELSYRRWLRSVCRPQHPYFFEWRDPGPTARSFALKAGRRLARLRPSESRAATGSDDR